MTGFFLSSEMKNKRLSNEEYVKRLYRTMLNRKADIGGLKNWVNQLNSGKTVEQVINGFVDSAEFTRLCNDYGVVRK